MDDSCVCVITVRRDILLRFERILDKTNLDSNAQMEQLFELFDCATEALSSCSSNNITLESVLKNLITNSLNTANENLCFVDHEFPLKCTTGNVPESTRSLSNSFQDNDNYKATPGSDVTDKSTEMTHTHSRKSEKTKYSTVPKRSSLKTLTPKRMSTRQKKIQNVKNTEMENSHVSTRPCLDVITVPSNATITEGKSSKCSVVKKNCSSRDDGSSTEKNRNEMDRESDNSNADNSGDASGINDPVSTADLHSNSKNRKHDSEKTSLCAGSVSSTPGLSLYLAGHPSGTVKPDGIEHKPRPSTVRSRHGLQEHSKKRRKRTTNSEERKTKFECHNCSKTFTSQAWYSTHMRNIHQDGVVRHTSNTFSCQECSRTFKSNSGLWLHVDKCHSGKSFVCSICNKALSDGPTLKKHMVCHTDVKQFTCNECGRQFSLKAYLRDHMRTHTGEKPYKCDICGREFAQTGYLTIHKRLHTGEKPYTCDVCGKQCSQAQHLKLHKRSHTGEKPYKCDLCDKSFTQVSNLNSHRRSHTGEKPFNCSACGKSFAQSSQLQTHLRTHTGVKPYKCEHCGKEFTQNVKLQAHVQRHLGVKNHLCSSCGKAFFSIHDMLKHKRTHVADKPHKCDVCGKGFIEAGYLRAHRRVHTGEKPYICDVCGKGFRLMAKLNKHKRTHREADVSQTTFHAQTQLYPSAMDTPASIPFPTPFPYITSSWDRDTYPPEPVQL